MLKQRIIGTLVVKNKIVVQSIGFCRYLPVGRAEIAAEFLNDWGIDEIILVDIDASRETRGPDLELVKRVADSCQVPLTVGGGIKNLNQIHDLLKCGADKVALNQPCLSEPQFLSSAASVFGNQCIVASIDAARRGAETFVFDYLRREPRASKCKDFALFCESLGAGEIFLNSVDRDGSKSGFDIPLITEVASNLSIPLIASGGAGLPQHLLEVLRDTPVDAVAAANFFHFFEHSVTITKACLANSQNIRHETQATYSQTPVDPGGRVAKRSESDLDELLYRKIAKEVI
jgi:cyclase